MIQDEDLMEALRYKVENDYPWVSNAIDEANKVKDVKFVEIYERYIDELTYNLYMNEMPEPMEDDDRGLNS